MIPHLAILLDVPESSIRHLLDLRDGTFESLRSLEDTEILRVVGFGKARIERLRALLNLTRSLETAKNGFSPDSIRCAQDALPELYALIGGRQEDESLAALYLDRRRQPIKSLILTRGTHAFTIVDSRQIYRHAVRLNACAVILAHNHPSGDPQPSPQDVEVTERVLRAGRLLGIPCLDHLILTERLNRWTSMATEGLCNFSHNGNFPTWTA